MTLLSLLGALLLEQFRPLPVQRWVLDPFARWSAWLEASFNGGDYRHGVLAWLTGVLPAVLLAGLGHALLAWWYPVLAWGWDVLVLYFTLGFRQFSHHFTEIHLALRLGDVVQARRLLARWRGDECSELSSSAIARLAIEEALLASHRHVFAVLLWFVLLGPAGAMLYRLSALLADAWSKRSGPASGATTVQQSFGTFAQQIFAIVDWLPQRTTATAFAIVGDFEDAVYCWRTQASQWRDRAAGIILASGAGALGVRLGMSLQQGLDMVERPELGLGDEADADFMQSTVGLVWRALVLWLLLLLLLELASWAGR